MNLLFQMKKLKTRNIVAYKKFNSSMFPSNVFRVSYTIVYFGKFILGFLLFCS